MSRAPLACALFICALLEAAGAGAATVRVVCRFDAPMIEALPGGFSLVVFDGAVQAGKRGEPSYPFRGVQILLPPGHIASSTRIVRGGWTVLDGAHRLFPAQEPVPGVDLDTGERRFLYDEAAYAVDRWMRPPDRPFATHCLRGHAIASGAVSPVEYRPASDAVGYYRTVEIVIETSHAAGARDALELLRRDGGTLRRLSRVVANPEALASYEPLAAPLRDPANEFEYLVVTGEQYAAAFEPLRAFYTRRGMRTAVMTVEEISAAFGGVDQAEKVRNCIKNKYVQNGITHVLLAGDWDGAVGNPRIVPLRGLYGEVHSSEVYVDEGMPADLYFGALDGTWNADNDALWGEIGEEDLYAEVAVGRAPVDTPEKVAAFIAKTIAYQESPVASEARSALLLGEKLWNDPLTYGDDEVELLVGARVDNGFTTTGIPADFSIVRKYDRTAVWTKAEAIAEINIGVNWLAHAGHSNHTYVMRMSRSDVTDAVFTNDGAASGFPIVLSTGCYAGAFDNRSVSGYYDTIDCIGELLVCINHGAAAFVCNSRYGWFTEGTTNGPSIHFMREFLDAAFSEGYTTLGAAHARSKDETVPFLDLPDEWEPGAFRWCFYESNLLGDPALDAWTDTPRAIAASYAPAIDRNDTLFAVDAGVPGAVGCLSRDGVWYARGEADETGAVAVVRSRALPDSVTWLELCVTAHDRFVLRDTIEVVGTADVPAAILAARLEQNFPNPFNPSTVIRFFLPRDGDVELAVFDASGRLVARLADGRMSRGIHSIAWAPAGRTASGVYFYSLNYQGIALVRKAIVLR
jgi:hypothetical protein